MLLIAGQTAGPNGLKLFVDTHGWPVGVCRKKFLFKFFFQHFFLFNFFSQHFFHTGNAEPFS